MEDNARLIVGIVCGILLLIKIQLHNLIDKKNSYYNKSSSGFRFNFIFLLPYYQETNTSTIKTKRLCNIFWTAFIVSLISIFFFPLWIKSSCCCWSPDQQPAPRYVVGQATNNNERTHSRLQTSNSRLSPSHRIITKIPKHIRQFSIFKDRCPVNC